MSNWQDPDGVNMFDRCVVCGAMVMRDDKWAHARWHRAIVEALVVVRADLEEVREVSG
jgi:hypothetical protein